MRIDARKLIDLRMPMDLLLNDVTAPILARKLQKKGVQITAAQLKTLFREVRRYRKSHPEWVPIEVETRDDGAVRILF